MWKMKDNEEEKLNLHNNIPVSFLDIIISISISKQTLKFLFFVYKKLQHKQVISYYHITY